MVNKVKKCSCGCVMPTTFSVGQRVHLSYDDGEINEYLICSANGLFGLVNINSGCHRSTFINVKSPHNITLNEFEEMYHRGNLLCSKCKTPYVEKSEYKVGQKFRPVGSYFCDHCTFILARSKYNEIVLIDMKDGNRWSDAVEVKDTHNITEDDFKKICNQSDYKFELIEG